MLFGTRVKGCPKNGLPLTRDPFFFLFFFSFPPLGWLSRWPALRWHREDYRRGGLKINKNPNPLVAHAPESLGCSKLEGTSALGWSKHSGAFARAGICIMVLSVTRKVFSGKICGIIPDFPRKTLRTKIPQRLENFCGSARRLSRSFHN